LEWIKEFSTQLGFAGIFSLSVLYLMFKFLASRNGGKDDRKPNGGMSVMQYLQTEIKPDLVSLQNKHEEMVKTVAALPNREEIQQKLTQIHARIDTKQDKSTPRQGEL